ncbi:hypothetical protein E2C01_099081 [Portunus trituberculatus]|uniref:Uncharacterized protein n=1 Tax=Portunus trituberculatus TaxID=210409 RepID=A0A5B7JZD5_PORTR|nr:hypothetical protein [Portunus trituberculatus]
MVTSSPSLSRPDINLSQPAPCSEHPAQRRAAPRWTQVAFVQYQDASRLTAAATTPQRRRGRGWSVGRCAERRKDEEEEEKE